MVKLKTSNVMAALAIGCAFSLFAFSLFPSLVSAQQSFELSNVNESSTHSSLSLNADSENLETLLDEAQQLFMLKQPIDARSKLLKALQLAPKDYRPHMMLGTYYLAEVGHFQLAYRYLLTAEQLFEAVYGNEDDQAAAQLSSPANRAKPLFPFRAHARLLYLLSEARLNLDDYKGSLETLDRFEKLYWDDWYPGTRAWVLMKLKRVDDAIKIAQRGILLDAEPTRTFNILGILFSLNNKRELSLEAFKRAIIAEYADGGTPRPATPLNNAGEVYSEMFQDRVAEAAWLRALQMPDGCDHVLPSLNLAILYINELRLLQAERVLRDFEACYAQQSVRSDTEHRSLLALARGRVALRAGETPKALALIQTAADRQQWFGKIGTDPVDLKFAATISLAQALRAEGSRLRDQASSAWGDTPRNFVASIWMNIRAWWMERRARNIGVTQLSDLEDLSIRNTDAMLEYPTFGTAFKGFPAGSFEKRIERMLHDDTREPARGYYRLYLATNLLAHGESSRAIELLKQADSTARPFDRLFHAEVLARRIMALDQESGWFGLSEAQQNERSQFAEELFEYLPSSIRIYDLALPISAVRIEGTESNESKKLVSHLLSRRFQIVPGNRRYELIVEVGNTSTPWTVTVWDKRLNSPVVHFRSVIGATSRAEAENSASSTVRSRSAQRLGKRELRDIADFYNRALDEIFHHRTDPPSDPLPELEIMAGLRG